MLIDNILNGLGATSSRRGSSAPRSGGTSNARTSSSIPLTAKEETATHRTGHYSSSGGLVERGYVDVNTGRQYYTVGDKAGTSEQVYEPRQQPAAADSTSFDFAPYIATYGGDPNNKAIRVYVGSKPNVISVKVTSRSGSEVLSPMKALTDFLTSYNQKQIDAEIAANGIDKPVQTTVRRNEGSYGNSNAQIQYGNISAQVEQMLFTNALAAGKVVTLQDVLASANRDTRSFYVPEGFWYVGDQPSATYNTNTNTATATATGYNNGYGTGNNNGYGTGNNNGYGTGNGNTEDEPNTMMWLLLPVLAIVGAKMMKKNTRKKR